MTEKIEDQVVWMCPKCCDVERMHDQRLVQPCTGTAEEYIPKSSYLALKSDLEKAVEALENIIKHQKSVAIFRGSTDQMSPTVRIAKEALGKIGEK